MRLISFNDFCTPSSPLFKSFKILKIFDLVKVLNIMFVHQFLNSNLPADLLDYFKFNKLNHPYKTRGTGLGLLTLPNSNTTRYGLHSLSKTTISEWNSLQQLYPQLSLSLMSLKALKSLSVRHYLSIY